MPKKYKFTIVLLVILLACFPFRQVYAKDLNKTEIDKKCEIEALSEAFVPGMQASQLKARMRGIYSGCRIRSNRIGKYKPFFPKTNIDRSTYKTVGISSAFDIYDPVGEFDKFFPYYDRESHACIENSVQTVNREINYTTVVQSFGSERVNIKLLPIRSTPHGSVIISETISLPISGYTAEATEEFEHPFFFANGETDVSKISKSVSGLDDWLKKGRMTGKQFVGKMVLNMSHDLYQKNYEAIVPFQIVFGGCRRLLSDEQINANSAQSLWLVTDYWIVPSTSKVYRSVKAIELSGEDQPTRVSFYGDYELVYENTDLENKQ